MEFPQVPVDKELFIKIPKEFELDTKGGTTEHLFEIHKNMYKHKQAGRVWYHHQVVKLIKVIGFTRSTVDKFIFYIVQTMYALPCTHTTRYVRVLNKRKFTNNRGPQES